MIMASTIHKSKLRPNEFIDRFYGKFSFQSYEDVQFYKIIQENGIKVPLSVTKSGLIISGNRRYYCAMQSSEIQEVPVIVEDIEDSDITEYLIVSLQQHRVKTDIQLAKEYKIIGDYYDIKRGKGNEDNKKKGKQERENLLEKGNVSETTIKRIVQSHQLIMELNEVDEDTAWEELTKLRVQKKMEPNKILNQLKDIKGEQQNDKVAKEIEAPNDEYFKIFSRSCEDLSDIIDDDTINCVCTSPPYYSGIRTYSEDGKDVKKGVKKEELEQLGHESRPEEYVEKMVMYVNECRRTLKQTGSIWINIMDVRKKGNYFNVPEKLLIALEKEGFITAQKCIWFKNNPPYDNNDVFQPSMEHIFHFVLDAKKYKWVDDWYDSADEFIGKITYGDKEKKRKFRNVFFYPSNKDDRNNNDGAGYVNSMLETNVINNSYLKKLLEQRGFYLQHNALFDLEVPMVCVLSTAEKGDSVLDIFSGLATTGIIAYANHCKYIGIELSSVYSAQSIVRFEDFLEKNPNIQRISN